MDRQNAAVASRLDEVAQILEEQGATRFRVRAYRRGAAAVRGLGRPVSELLREGGSTRSRPSPISAPAWHAPSATSS